MLLVRDERLVRTAHFAGTGILNCSRRLFLVFLKKHCREREGRGGRGVMPYVGWKRKNTDQSWHSRNQQNMLFPSFQRDRPHGFKKDFTSCIWNDNRLLCSDWVICGIKFCIDKNLPCPALPWMGLWSWKKLRSVWPIFKKSFSLLKTSF